MMSADISYSRFVHADTNILSEFAKKPQLWRPLQDFLHEQDLCLGISGAQVAELSSDNRLHEPLNVLLTPVPAALIKPPELVLKEEVNSHPKKRTEGLLQYPLNALLGKRDFGEFLSSSMLSNARNEQRNAAQLWMKRLQDLKPNFPPKQSGKYSQDQADLFAWTITIQELSFGYLDFLAQFKDKVANLETDAFPSIKLMGYVIFYKYYLVGQQPKDSDFGDMFHLYDIPYSKLAIMERNMCGILNQIKKNHDALNGVTIMNKDFLNDWKWTENVRGGLPPAFFGQ
jgi:hypothetical protein